MSDFSHSRDASFVELLSAADRPKFLHFVSASASGDISPSSLPRGLRVTLCGRASGDTGRRRRELSVDLFHVALPGYHLLATGWWFGTFFIFPYTWNFIIPIDSYFSEG